MGHQILISGVGGQGVLLITRVLAEACMDEGWHVLTSETHGMAQRGGTVVSHLKIGNYSSPLIRPGCADILAALKLDNFVQHKHFLKEKSVAIVNTAGNLKQEPGKRVISIDADYMAKEGKNRSVNLYLLGALLANSDFCPVDTVCGKLKQLFTNKDEKTTRNALKSLETGYDSVAKEN